MQYLKSVAGIVPAVLALALSSVHAAEDYSTWPSYKSVVVNTKTTGAGVGANVLNYPVLVRLDSTAADVFAQAGTNGASVRFAKPSGAARPYQIESWDATAKKASIWVLADTVKGNDSAASLRLYWGKAGAADSSKSAAVFDSAYGYKAVFHLNEADSTNIHSSATDTLTGVNTSTTATSGIAGPARNFAGTNPVNSSSVSTTGRQYIDMGTPAPLNFAGRITFSSWVRWVNVAPTTTTGSTHYRNIIQREGTSPSAETFLRIGHTSGTQAQSQYASGKYSGSTDIFAQSPQIASAYPDSAQWIHLAGTYDSSASTPAAGLWRVFRNGVQVGTDPYAGAVLKNVTATATVPKWWIGRTTGQANRYFSGDIDELRVANVTRDSTFIKLDYETQKPGTAAVKLGATQSGAPSAPSNLVYSPDTLKLNLGVAANRVPTYVGTVDSFTVTPAFPDSLKLNKTTGAITGTARSLSALTAYVIRATNSIGFTTDTVYVSITAAPPTLVYAVQVGAYNTGADISPNVPAVSGLVDSFTVAPALPAGLVLSKTSGVISGRPSTVSAASNYVVTATNGSGTARDTISIAVSAASADAAYSTWSNHKVLVVNARAAGVLQSLRGFPLLVRLDSANFSAGFGQAAYGGSDIRFTKTGDVVRLPYQIESWDAAAKRAAIWVRVDTVRGDNVTNIRMHWGKSGVADSSKGSAVFGTSDGFGAVWHMNEPSGNILDATANGVVGTNNGTTATTGIIGVGRNFAGNNPGNNVTTGVQTISVGDPAELDLGTGRVTLEAWVRWDRIRPTTGTVFWRNILMRQSGNDELHLRVDGNTPYNYRTGVYISSTDYGPLSDQAASAYGDSAKWVHLAGVYDSVSASTSAWKLYRNGVLAGQGGEGEPNVTDRGTWYIGSWSGTTNRRFWAGDMDEMRISKTHRSAGWVKLSYETQKAGVTALSFSDTIASPLAIGRSFAQAGGVSLSSQRMNQGILFQVRGAGNSSVRLTVLDMRGREVWTRFARGTGDRSLLWEGSTRTGIAAPSGIYAVRVSLVDAEGRVTATLEQKIPLMH